MDKWYRLRVSVRVRARGYSSSFRFFFFFHFFFTPKFAYVGGHMQFRVLLQTACHNDAWSLHHIGFHAHPSWRYLRACVSRFQIFADNQPKKPQYARSGPIPIRIFFWTGFKNLVAKRRKINDRVVPILVAIHLE